MADILLNDPQGNPVTVPEEHAQESMASGFTAPTGEQYQDYQAEQQKQQKYGEGLGNELKAGALGAGETATFGLSNLALTKSGMMSPEDIKETEERNPMSHLAGEAGGVAGAVFLGPESALGKAAIEGGGLAGAAVKGLSAADLIGAGAASVAKKVLPNAFVESSPILAKAAIGAAKGAMEGAVYTTGGIVNDYALGDPDLNAEKIASAYGYGALFGGALGSLAEAGKGSYEKWFPKEGDAFVSELDKGRVLSPEESFDMAVNSPLLSEQEKNDIFKGMKDIKGNSKEIEAAADRIGAPVLESQISASKAVQNMDSYLMNTSESTIAQQRKQVLQSGYEAVQNAVNGAVGQVQHMSAAEIGDAVKQSLTSKIQEEYKPINALYDTIKQSTDHIEVSENAKRIISANIAKVEGYKYNGSTAKALGDFVLGNMENIKTVDDAKAIATQLWKHPAAMTDKYTAGIIAEKLQNLQESSIIRTAEKMANETGDQGVKESILGLLDQREAANKSYKTLREKMGELGETLGKKKIRGTADFLNFLEDLTPEKLANKLFSKNDSEFVEWFAKHFPQESKSVLDYHKSQLLSGLVQDGKVNALAFIKKFEKLSPEMRSNMFGKEGIQKIMDSKTWLDSLPKNINPSGTAHALELGSQYGSLFGAAAKIAEGAGVGAAAGGIPGAILGAVGGAAYSQRAHLRDYALRAIIRDAVKSGSGEVTRGLVDKLVAVEGVINRTNHAVRYGTASVFNYSTKAIPRIAGSTLMLSQMSSDDKDRKFKNIQKKLQDSTSDPSAYIDNLHNATSHIGDIAPNIAGSLSMSMARSAEFLKSKMPSTQKQSALSSPPKPSDAELSKFFRYVQVAENPFIAFQQIKEGTLSGETMETLSACSPLLLKEMQQSIMTKITDGGSRIKEMPYKTKIMLSLFLNSDLVDSLANQNMMLNQQSFALSDQKSAPQGQRGQKMKSTQTGLGKLDIASRYNTPLSDTVQRERI